MIRNTIVHNGTDATSQPRDTSNSNPLTAAKVQIPISKSLTLK